MVRVVVALGGNALNRAGGDGGWAEAGEQMRRTASVLAELVRDGHELILTHGNGPQVGALLRQNEVARREVPPRPLHVLGAETEGQIGYLIQRELTAALEAAKTPRTVVVFLSRVEVAANDPSFRTPSKPIGPYYTEEQARLLRKNEGWQLEFDRPRGGWRRVVASPVPVRWIEGEEVARFLGPGWADRFVPVVTGGGGVPVVRRRGGLEGVDAVIDKDRTAALVGTTLRADTLAIVTDVPGVAVGFGKPWERWLGDTTSDELARALAAGEFGAGSMAPKIEAVLSFLAAGGRRAVITDAPSLWRSLRGEAGTRVGPRP